jgi:hypothetical protein
MLCQILSSLTLTKPKMQDKKGWREYNIIITMTKCFPIKVTFQSNKSRTFLLPPFTFGLCQDFSKISLLYGVVDYLLVDFLFCPSFSLQLHVRKRADPGQSMHGIDGTGCIRFLPQCAGCRGNLVHRIHTLALPNIFLDIVRVYPRT